MSLASNTTATSAASVGSPPLLPAVPALDNTFGAVLIGTCIGLIFYGLTAHQTYRYFRLYPNDVSILKVLVTVLMYRILRLWDDFAAPAHTVSIQVFGDFSHYTMHPHVVRVTISLATRITKVIWHSYYYLTTNYFNPASLLSGVWSLRLIPVVTGTVIFVCHSFYARRVYLIGGLYRPLVAIVILLMFGELSFVVASTTEAFLQPSFASWEHFTWLISAGFGCAVGADAVLTSALTFVLHRSRTGFKSTDSMIDVLIVYTINTGLLTGLFSVLSLVFAVVFPNNLIYVALNMVSTRSYANSVLAVLNSRRSLVERRFAELEAGTFGMSALDSGDTRPKVPEREDVIQLPPRVRSTVIDIKVQADHVQRADSTETLSVVEVKKSH
ncbi:uncharacterized protein TRAVEDRAFT_48863 [Trametes versicolor FP-101664 SS1]|uniref:uncharacterized protein n=1 Tax=Trametes versicolor (strain FP-101664) TaxID=717944 RepID=UPI0004623346|nr:uncharacterized protein TRAVEDRAFT_48863 [Trametes versicolor FP-101664 SS1]EIW57836.1 hypothetical protein TRAVEDRAFT_48863 [Trametes versicolor FP-101664 SS1]